MRNIRESWDIPGYDWAVGDPRYINSFKKYLNYIKICMPGNSCWKSIGNNGIFSNLSNTNYGDYNYMVGCRRCDDSLTLANGVTVFFDDESGVSYLGNVAIGIIADLNGIRSPNVIGKDIFFIWALCKWDSYIYSGGSCLGYINSYNKKEDSIESSFFVISF